MSRNVLINILFINLLSFFLLTGCATTIGEKPQRKSDTLYGSAFPVETIDQAITKFKNILNTVDLPGHEREMITDFISKCEELKSIGIKRISNREYREAVILLLEEAQKAYERLAEPELAHSVINSYFLLKKEIRSSFLVGDYRQVINLCVDMEKRFGGKSLTPETGTMFAVSLAENGMLREAIDIGESIMKEMAASPDLVHLISGIIEWELESGNTEKALEKYEKLIDSMTERNALYNRTIERVTAETEDIPSETIPHRDDFGTLDRSSEIRALLDDVEKLLNSEEYGEARLRLLRWRLRAEDGPEIEIIENALRMVELAESRPPDTTNNDNIIITEANALIENEKYEEALSILEPLTVNVLFPNREAEKLKDIAVENLIRREQMKAGEYFLMARNSREPAEKKKYLNTSLDILNSLIEEYPLSPLIDRINNHIRRVREEMESLNN